MSGAHAPAPQAALPSFAAADATSRDSFDCFLEGFRHEASLPGSRFLDIAQPATDTGHDAAGDVDSVAGSSVRSIHDILNESHHASRPLLEPGALARQQPLFLGAGSSSSLSHSSSLRQAMNQSFGLEQGVDSPHLGRRRGIVGGGHGIPESPRSMAVPGASGAYDADISQSQGASGSSGGAGAKPGTSQSGVDVNRVLDRNGPGEVDPGAATPPGIIMGPPPSQAWASSNRLLGVVRESHVGGSGGGEDEPGEQMQHVSVNELSLGEFAATPGDIDGGELSLDAAKRDMSAWDNSVDTYNRQGGIGRGRPGFPPGVEAGSAQGGERGGILGGATRILGMTVRAFTNLPLMGARQRRVSMSRLTLLGGGDKGRRRASWREMLPYFGRDERVSVSLRRGSSLEGESVSVGRRKSVSKGGGVARAGRSSKDSAGVAEDWSVHRGLPRGTMPITWEHAPGSPIMRASLVDPGTPFSPTAHDFRRHAAPKARSRMALLLWHRAVRRVKALNLVWGIVVRNRMERMHRFTLTFYNSPELEQSYRYDARVQVMMAVGCDHSGRGAEL
eukprot:jgi/Mesvir1/25523/Mv01773-RA.1